MRFFYNLSINLFSLMILLASTVNSKARKLLEGRRALAGHIEQDWARRRRSTEKTIWIHCASLGEFEQGRSIIEAIKCDFPQYAVVLTFFSPSGYEVRKNYAQADAVYYLPADTPSNARRFVAAIKPDVAIFVKYEYWYNYLAALRRAGARSYVVSAIFRPGMRFFKPAGGFFRQMLRLIDHFFVQNDQSAALLSTIGITDNVTVCGDTRFDRVADIAHNAPRLPIVEQFAGDSPVMVCGSTWQPDIDILLELMHAHPGVKFVVAPHQISEAEIERLIKLSARPAMRYTQRANPEATLLVVDCIGILSGVYRYGQIAYIGGGFGVGIHNVLEAATWGLPVIFGPKYERFAEAVDLVGLGGAISVSNSCELLKAYETMNLDRGKLSQIASEYVGSKTGATHDILDYVFRQRH